MRTTGNLTLAQMVAVHADIGTTANIYAHLDTTDLETALRALNAVTYRNRSDRKPCVLRGLWRRRESNPRKIPAESRTIGTVGPAPRGSEDRSLAQVAAPSLESHAIGTRDRRRPSRA
jgi:hypothetical protein